MSLTAYPTLRLKLTMPQALKLQFLPAIPGSSATAAAAAAEAAAAQAQAAADAAVAATANKVDKSGDVMSGFLTLNADPTAVLHAATKQYVDSHSGAGITDGNKGDITVSGSGAVWTIDNDAVTYAKIQNVSVTARFLGRFSGGTGNVEEGTGTQATALLDVFTSTLKGLAPLSGGGTTNFLRADGTWATPPGGGGGLSDAFQIITDGTTPSSAVGAGTFKLRTTSPLTVATQNNDATHGDNALFGLANGDRGDITLIGATPGTTWTIDNDVVTYAKMQNVSAASRLIGRGSAGGLGDPEEITLGTGLSMTGTTLAATASAPATPTRQIFTSGSGTYTTPANCRWIEVELVGGGGGGGGGSNTGGTGGTGGNTTFSTLAGGGGGGGGAGFGGAVGTASGGDINFAGARGATGANVADGITFAAGNTGGTSYFSSGGVGAYAAVGGAPSANSGAGGAGGGTNSATANQGGGGGAAGGYVRKLIVSPAATYSYAVGAAGTLGAGNAVGYNGAAGAAGIIIVTEYY
jgi:Repeat of unknown function (DUF5907)